MTPQLTPEQLRRIDALVAECMGWTNITALPESGDWIGNHPKSGAILSIPLFCGDYQMWAIVERWMVDYATEAVQRYYVYALELRTGHMIFNMLTSPLHVRCLAFLSAMGKDVEAILKEKADESTT